MKLSDEQMAVVNDWQHNILLTAIPGSGKTRTIVQKIIEKLKMNDSNKVIVGITYTNRAADEMLERVYKEVGETEQVFIGTIHSFCYEFIFKRHYDKLNSYKNGYKIISPELQNNLIQDIASHYSLSVDEKKYISLGKIKTTITKDSFYIETNSNYVKILNDFYNTLKKESLLNFDLLLYLSYFLLNSYNYIANQMKNAIECFYVDEYQDTSQLQYDILSCIYKANSRKQQLIFVGDENQAIYTSLGSITKSAGDLAIEFGTDFICKKLTGCYRSYQGIIDFYKNFAINDVKMNSKISGQDSVVIEKYIMDEEACFSKVVSVIDELLNDGVSENNICIMAPWWYLLLPITQKLKNLRPTIKFDAPEISPIKRNDDLPLYKLSKLICMSISHENINYKRHLVMDFKSKFKEFYNINLDINVDEFLTEIENRRKVNTITIGTDYLKNEINYFLISYFKINNNEINEEVEKFMLEINKRISKNNINNVPDTFMSMFSRKDGIVISTCHGVKGEEYDAVICLYVTEGKIPHFTEVDNRDIANKLLFVMFSRARKYIYVFSTIKDSRDVPTLEIQKINM